MQFFSDKSSLASNTPTVLACLESLIAAIVVLFVLIPGESYWIWALYSAAGWTLLLRTKKSTQVGLRWFKRTCVFVNPFFEMKFESVDFRKQGWMGLAKLGLLLIVSVFAIFLKTAATVRSLLLNPIKSIQSIPTNWKRSMFCVDSACPFEVMPGVLDQLGALERQIQNQSQHGTDQPRPFLVDFLDTSHGNIFKNSNRTVESGCLRGLIANAFFLTVLVCVYHFMPYVWQAWMNGDLLLFGFVECLLLLILNAVFCAFVASSVASLFVKGTDEQRAIPTFSALLAILAILALGVIIAISLTTLWLVASMVLYRWQSGHLFGIIFLGSLLATVMLASIPYGVEYSLSNYPGRLLFFIPAITYRISLKLTIILYMPLLLTASKTSDVRRWIRQTRIDKWRTFSILAACTTLVVFLGKSLLLGISQKYGISPIVTSYLAIDRMPLWQLAGLVVAVLTIASYLWSDIHLAMRCKVTKSHELAWNSIQILRSLLVNYLMIGHVRFALLLLDLPFALPHLELNRFFPEPW